MTRLQLIIIGSALALFGVLSTCKTQAPAQAKAERTRNIEGPTVDISELANNASMGLTAAAKTEIDAAAAAVAATKSDTEKAAALKKLSSLWYKAGKIDVAGNYAFEVAKLEKTATAWEIAGANLSLAVRNSTDDAVRMQCTKQAATAFENAISLEPQEVKHKVNLAVIYTDNPPQDNPMKGILMLRELDTQYPNNVGVLSQLGRLAIKTGQWEKAITRLEAAQKVDPANNRVTCLLVEAYKGAGQTDKAKALEGKCAQATE